MPESNSISFFEFPQGFDILKKSPVDSRSVFATLAERDALQAGQRYHGLLTFVQSEGSNGTFYYLKSGLTNDDWEPLANPQNNSPSTNVWKELTLPFHENFALEITENTNSKYVKDGSSDPAHFFKVKLEFLSHFDSDPEYYYEIDQYEALYYHRHDLSLPEGGPTMIPLTPLQSAFADVFGIGSMNPKFKMPDNIGQNGVVGLSLSGNTPYPGNSIYKLYYPAEVGELTVRYPITS